MKLTKCVNGHFYDEEKFGTCPHCAGTSKLNASNIFGQSSAPAPAAEEAPAAPVTSAGDENNDAAAPLEWEPAVETAEDQAGFEAPAEDTSAPVSATDFSVEEPGFVDVPKEPAFTAPSEEPEFVDAPTETAFTAPPEEPEFSPAPTADVSASTDGETVDEEAAFDINSQPSFDTPLDFDSDFAASPLVEKTDSEEEPEEEEEEGFELLSKYSSDTPAEETQEASAVDEPPAWEMPQPSVEEIKTENQETVESVVDPELEERPTEIVEEKDADLMNGLLSEDEITGNTSQPAFSPEPEAPAFSAEPEAPAFSPEPEAPAFSAEPEAPAFSPEPEAPAFSAEPVNPAFVPEQPAAFDLSSDEDDDDDGHTVAFYDDIFTEVSKTAVAAAESTMAAQPSDPFTEAANAAAEVAMNAMPAATDTATVAEEAPAAGVEPVASAAPADASASAVEEPNVFTAPPLPKVQNLPTPCVGWLIALNGTHVGQDFHLRVGKNYVGRDESMDVALTGDKSVSRHKHAIVVYEPKHHKYFVQPGESNELIYVNDEVVLLPMELKPYDLLVIGDVELWFMPLCDAEHNWSEIIRKLQEQMQQ